MELRALSPSSSRYQSKLSTLFHLSRSASTPSSLLQRRSRALVLPLQQRRRSVDVVMPRACLKLEEERVSETGRKWGKVSAVLFDMDGVLCNSEEPSRRAAVDVFAEMGAKVTVDDFVRFMGTGEANFLGGVASVKGVEGLNTEAAKKESFEIYLDKYAKPNSGIGFPGALELITQCKRKGLKVAVASSADRIKVDANLAAAGLPFSLFDAIVSADAFENLEPAPDIFLAASKILNVPISECIVIEDALAGMQAAKAAQMRCIAVTMTLAQGTLKTAGPALIRQEMGTMNTTTTSELPCGHFEPKYHTPETPPTFKLSHKAILNLLNTKCTTSLQHLKQTHALILKTGHYQDHYISGSLVKSYANPHFGTLDFAIQVFKQVQSPNVFVWNFLFKGFLDNNQPFNAIFSYSKMVCSASKPNKHTYPPLLKACTLLGAVEEGVQVHAQVVKFRLSGDKYIKSAGIRMYASFGRVLDARTMFDGSTESEVVCGNAMIDGYMKCGYVEDARKVFEDMIEKNIGTWTVMISGFARCGMIEEAREIFNRMPERDDVSWSAIIDGYNKGGYYKEALEIFQEMQREKIKPKKFVLSSVLASCANVVALNQGRWIHTYIQSNSIPLNEVLGTSLVDMYAQCGCIDLAWEVFGKMKHKEVFSWNAMIGGLAVNGHARDAIELFCKMQREKVKPNAITFVGILNACAHEGLVDEGLDFLRSMKQEYGVEPKVEHYGCVVDLLGRVGLLNEAEEVINSMPIEPNAAVWGALLGACRKHGNVELAERVGKIVLELEPRNSGRYALLSNIYAKAGRWEDVANLRKLMKERGVKTITGRSMIDLDGTVHEFKMGDESHPQVKEIYSLLERVIGELLLEGYLPNTSQVLFDIEEEEKENSLRYHSEKLAIAFGLLKTTPGTTIRIVKNLRVCDDCHSATKLISKIYKRKIIVRDRVRYHHFENGTCSCRDFW